MGGVGNEWRTDEALRLKSIPGHVTSFAYNARGQVTQATYANGVVTTNTYNEQRVWLTRVETVNRRDPGALWRGHRQSNFADKIWIYWKAREAGTFKATWGASNVRILTVTASDESIVKPPRFIA